MAAIFLATVLFLGLAATGGEPVPLLSELRPPVEEVVVEQDDEPVLPAPVLSSNRVSDITRLCPPDAAWYLEIPDAYRTARNWDDSSIGAFMNEPTIKLTFRNNRFGLKFLFSDLPESVITPDRIAAAAEVLELSRVVASMSERMAMAGYIRPHGEFEFLFLFDVGLDRLPTFQKMGEWETSFFVGNPGAGVLRGDHSGNFLDVWQLGGTPGVEKRSEVTAGFAENIMIISNSPDLAASSLALLAGGDSLAASSWRKTLADATYRSADLVGFIRMDAIRDGLRDMPIAQKSVASWADFLGYGGGEGEAIYYSLQILNDGTREAFLLPAAGNAENASLVELLAKRLKPTEKWASPEIIPYNPNPVFHFGARIDGKELGNLLQQQHRLFGLSNGQGIFHIPPEAQRLFTDSGISSLLTGEIGLTFFPGSEFAESWLMILPCTGNPAPLLKRAVSSTERNRVTIHSSGQDWWSSLCWVAVPKSAFRRLDSDFLVIASNGDLLQATLEQLQTGTSFSLNRNFTRALSQSEAEPGMIFYVNVPEIVVRQYPNLSSIMRSFYPRSSGLNNRPPLALLRRYSSGALAAAAVTPREAEFTRVTVQSPLPSLVALAAGTILRFPLSMREAGRKDMAESRQNMKELWLRLQLYSNRYGHFPESLDHLAAEMREDASKEDIQSFLIAPAALSRFGRDEALVNSYRYLSGITPNDEPDIPILYEAEPWSEDFSGRHPTEANRSPTDSGDFIPYRQMVLLDGSDKIMPERQFREKVLKRLTERE
ncbi:MAG: hypothetical protein FWG74_04360 [Planctomycetes bacterium]|nr:hypothetical protein [Planctomycetota bacterium]